MGLSTRAMATAPQAAPARAARTTRPADGHGQAWAKKTRKFRAASGLNTHCPAQHSLNEFVLTIAIFTTYALSLALLLLTPHVPEPTPNPHAKHRVGPLENISYNTLSRDKQPQQYPRPPSRLGRLLRRGGVHLGSGRSTVSNPTRGGSRSASRSVPPSYGLGSQSAEPYPTYGGHPAHTASGTRAPPMVARAGVTRWASGTKSARVNQQQFNCKKPPVFTQHPPA